MASHCSPPPIALCLGGLDPSAGAGLLRDALTLAGFGIHPMGVSLGDTLQNGEACRRIVPPALDPCAQVANLEGHLNGAWGLKLGMCALTPDQLDRLLRILDPLEPRARIWDPVLAPTSGVGLHDPAGLRSLAERVLSHPGWVVSPNRPEASAFSGLLETDAPERLAKPWLEAGAVAVWLKGGHGEGDWVEDFWIDAAGVRSLGRHPRLPGSRRGTGCTLASAWLGLRLAGHEPVDAALRAAEWLRANWASAFAPGGFGRPVFAPGRT